MSKKNNLWTAMFNPYLIQQENEWKDAFIGQLEGKGLLLGGTHASVQVGPGQFPSVCSAKNNPGIGI